MMFVFVFVDLDCDMFEVLKDWIDYLYLKMLGLMGIVD